LTLISWWISTVTLTFVLFSEKLFFWSWTRCYRSIIVSHSGGNRFESRSVTVEPGSHFTFSSVEFRVNIWHRWRQLRSLLTFIKIFHFFQNFVVYTATLMSKVTYIDDFQHLLKIIIFLLQRLQIVNCAFHYFVHFSPYAMSDENLLMTLKIKNPVLFLLISFACKVTCF
jgi:hypothetical protein